MPKQPIVDVSCPASEDVRANEYPVTVGNAGIHVQLGLDASSTKAQGVVDVFIAEAIRAADADERGGKA